MKMKGNLSDKQHAEMYLYGVIGTGQDIDTIKLVSELEKLRKQGCKAFTFYVNSDGGEVVQGSSLFNYLDRTDVAVTWVVDGIAASMMAMLLCNPKHTVKASEHAKFMYHRVQGFVYGDSAKVRSHADMIDTFEASLIAMMARRTGATAVAMKAEFFTDGADHWLSAAQAKERGLCDEIISSGWRMQAADLGTLTTARDVYNFYNNQIINFKKKDNMDKSNLFALALGLPESDDEGKVLAHVQGIVAQNTTLTAQLKAEQEKATQLGIRLAALEKAKITNMIDAAVAAKKIGADEKDTYTALAEKDFAGVEKILNKLPGVAPVAGALHARGVAAKYEGKSWDELDKAGLLASLKSEDPERYAQFYSEKFGKK
jgi:ATP-dependent protease ClpP protease subunit